MRTRGLAVLLVLTALVLTGCKSTLLVHDTTVETIIPIFKDYVGIHGYQITYENDQSGSFRLSLGSVYEPSVSETQKTKMVITQPPAKDSNQPTTSYEDTTWQTVSTPGHYVEATAMVSITQQDNDVIIVLDGNSAAGSSLDDIKDYIREFGYAVDNK